MGVGFVISWHKQGIKSKTEIENIPDSTDAECATCAHNKEMLNICEKHSKFLTGHTEEQKDLIDRILKRESGWIKELERRDVIIESLTGKPQQQQQELEPR